MSFTFKRADMRTSVTLLMFAIAIIHGCSEQHYSEVPEGNEVLLGIFGGMGPEATLDFYKNLLEVTPASKDQEHIPTIIFSNTKVPDRIAAIAESGGDIIPYLEFSIRKLDEAGASFIAIPCNTVHYFHDEMQSFTDIPVLHLIREAAEEVAASYPGVRKVGLLATTATIESGLYHMELNAKGIEVVIPDEDIIVNNVMEAVFGIKAGTDMKVNEELLAGAALNLQEKGAELIVLGCTEIPLAYDSGSVDLPYINPTRVLAEKSVEMYRSMITAEN